MNLCKYCGTKIFEQDRKCPSCGAPLEGISTNAELLKKTYEGSKAIAQGGVGNRLLFTMGEWKISEDGISQ